MKFFICLTILGFAVATLTGCKLRTYNPSEKYSTASAKLDRQSYFNHDQLWYARISGWDKSKIQSWEISEKNKVTGARFELFKLPKQKADETWCPTPEELNPKDKIFSTTHFNVSLRGDKSKGTPKGSYLINFENEGERFVELKRMHLVAMFNDMSQMREALSQTLMSFVRVPAPRNSYLRFCMDDVYRGLYLNIEEVDQQFIADVLGKPQFVSVYEGTDGNEPDSGQLARRVGSSSSEEKFAGKGYKKSLVTRICG